MMVMALPGSLLDNGSVYIYHQNESYMYSSAEYKNMMIGALYRDQDSSSIALLVLYVLVFFLAVISNVLVILVIYRFQHLRSVTNYFLVNLSVADLLVTLVCMPMAMSQQVSVIWFYGLFMCKFSAYLQGVAASSSVFSILAMSMDRYFAIRHPIIFRQFFNKRVARCVILVIWLVAGLLFVPTLVVQQQQPLKLLGNIGNELYICDICHEEWKEDWNQRTYSICHFVAVYALPVSLVLTAYIRMGCKLCTPSDIVNNRDGSRLLDCRRRVARTLLVLAFVFALCWMPYNLIQLLLDHLDLEQRNHINLTVKPYSLWLGHANSAVNPLLYCLFSRNIRQSLWELFHSSGGSSRNLAHNSDPLPLASRRHRQNRVSKRRITLPTVPERRHQRQVEELVIRRDSIVVSPMTPSSILTNNNKKFQYRRHPIRRVPGATASLANNNSSFTTALLPVQQTNIGSLNKLAVPANVASPAAGAAGQEVIKAALDRAPSNCHSL